jgi:serine/threonine protein phosphatase PrpC
LSWSAGVLIGFVIVIYFPAADGLHRLLVDLLAFAALALVVAAWREPQPAVQAVPVPFNPVGPRSTGPVDPSVYQQPTEQSGAPQEVPPPVTAPGGAHGGPPVVRQARIRRPAGYDLEKVPQQVDVVRFGPGARAQRRPWLLPPQPATAPGLAADQAALGDLELRAASIVGPGHRCAEPAGVREDAYRVARDRDGRHLVIALADGLSSSTHAALGATVAAGSAVTLILERLHAGQRVADLRADEVFEAVAARMRHEAQGRGLDPAATSAVLVCAVLPCHPDQDGSRSMWTAWAGDASMWALRGGRWQRLVGDEKPAEAGISSNEVRQCLPERVGRPVEKVWQVDQGNVFCLVSDGVGDGLASIAPLNAHLAEQWAAPPRLSTFISQVGFDAKGYLDDRTAVTVWVGPGGRR